MFEDLKEQLQRLRRRIFQSTNDVTIVECFIVLLTALERLHHANRKN